MVDVVSPALARRIALAAQGFGRPIPAAPGARALGGVVDRLGLLQIDSVNVFERSHYLPAFSRIGGYDRAALDRLAWGRRGRLVEYWAHQAAFIPRELWPMFEFRREEYRRSGTSEWGGWLSENRRLADWLRAELAANGPMPASAIEHDANERRGPWWGWSDVKRTLEWMFRTGEVVCVDRRRFERVYALPEQALDPALLDAAPAGADQVRTLVERAASALGIATAADLADYWRMKSAQVRPAVDLVEAGVLLPVEVPGWTTGSRPAPAWLHRDARRPRRIEAAALLSPFDPVVWFRPRAERLFDFHYRIEIYTPEPQRRFGYYSLPVVIDDAVVARVDLKSDRAAGVLRVQSAWAEPHAPAGTAERLVPELRRAADWQGLGEIVVAGRGDLSPAIASALAAA